MTAPTIAEIAAGLTKAPRGVVRRGDCSGDTSIVTIRALIFKGLLYLRIDSPDGRCGFAEPTPLGLALAEHLRAQPANG